MVTKKRNFTLLILLVLFLMTVLTAEFFLYVANLGTNEDITQSEVLPKKEFNPASLSWDQTLFSAPWEGRDSHAVVVYDNKIWLMGGLDGNGHITSPGNVNYEESPHFSDVWSSEDGENWKLVADKSPWGDRRSIQIVDFKGKMWLMGGWGPEAGYKNDVWSSTDGINWNQETQSADWQAREGHQLLVFQNKIWLIGGVRYDLHKLFTDVWYSEDGINWIEATEDAGWSPRWDFASTVYNNKLWTMGGMDFEGNLYNDVWSSADGVNWSLVNGNPPFLSRQGGAIVDYKDRLWVVGRLNIPLYGNGSNDVWYSQDGVNWQKTDKDPLWTGREDVSIIVFKDKIWVLGGMDKNWIWTNDVWYSKL